MADPATLGVLKVVGPLALQAVGMAGGAIGAGQEAGQNAEAAGRQGDALRNQNARLQAGQAPPPAYSQSVGGYGMPGADGQYAYMSPPQASFDNDPALQQPGYGSTEGRQQAFMQQVMQSLPPGLFQPDPAQQAYLNQPPPRGPAPAQEPGGVMGSVFGIPVNPVWFDDGPAAARR